MHYRKYSNCQKYGRLTDDGRKVFLHDWEIHPTYWKCKACGSSKTTKPKQQKQAGWGPNPNSNSSGNGEPYVGSARYYEDVRKRAREAAEEDARRKARSSSYRNPYGNFWDDVFGGGNRGPEPIRRPDSFKPVQVQIIEFFQSLAKSQSLGFGDGEIVAMWHIALKKAGVEK